jgi:Secretion system C-terminal sorting domain
MKHIYSLITLLAFSLFYFSVNAQTYTAVRSGNWHSAGPNVWDPNGEPPATCNNCTITIVSGNTITLNTSVTLKGSTRLILGTDATLGNTVLQTPVAGSGGTNFATGFNIILDNTGGVGNSKIVLTDNTVSIVVPATTPAAAGMYDGVLASNNGFLKVIGNAPVGFFADGSVQFMGNTMNNPLVGPTSINAFGTLPIVLSAWSAALDGKGVQLNWTSSMEINSDHFAIERSTDAGAHWAVLGTVAAHGSSDAAVNYSFTDLNPAAGSNEYRLQMVDRDARYTYSDVKVVRTGLISSVSLYPNPARDYVNVTLAAEANLNVSIRLISQAGQLLLEKRVDNAGGMTVSLPVSGYPQGNYLVLVTGADGTTQVNKLLISKQ